MEAIFLLCLVASPVVLQTVNIAFNAGAKYCNFSSPVTAVTDGNISSIFETRTPCFLKSFVSIDFGKDVYIHYGVIYGGPSDGDSTNHLDYFMARVIKRTYEAICSRFPNTRLPHNHGMRVNCNHPSVPFTIFRIYSEVNLGMSVAEIDVYTFASTSETDLIFIPRGCYETIKSVSLSPLIALSICQAECKSHDVTFAAIRNNEECHCVLELKETDHRPLRECNQRCEKAEVEAYCGGEDRYTVYLVNLELPKYLTCVRFSNITEGDGFTDASMTVEHCLKMCEHSRIALLTGGDTCMCTDRAEQFDDDDSFQALRCLSRCAGDSAQFCGGNGFVSVYRTCYYSDSYKTTCSNVFQCSGEMNQYGACKTGCRSGFIGEHCLERRSLRAESQATGDEGICGVYNPCRSILNSNCTDIDDTYECDCMKGYENSTGTCEETEKDNAYKEPSFVDGSEECPEDVCNLKTSECRYSNGTSVCLCKPGYVDVLSYCADITIAIITFCFAVIAVVVLGMELINYYSSSRLRIPILSLHSVFVVHEPQTLALSHFLDQKIWQKTDIF